MIVSYKTKVKSSIYGYKIKDMWVRMKAAQSNGITNAISLKRQSLNSRLAYYITETYKLII